MKAAAHPDDHHNVQQGCEDADEPDIRLQIGPRLNSQPEPLKRFPEGDHVRGNRHRLGDLQRESNRVPDRLAERPAHDVVPATTLAPEVRRALGHSEGRLGCHSASEKDDPKVPENRS